LFICEELSRRSGYCVPASSESGALPAKQKKEKEQSQSCTTGPEGSELLFMGARASTRSCTTVLGAASYRLLIRHLRWYWANPLRRQRDKGKSLTLSE